jgi:hypothetical protein
MSSQKTLSKEGKNIKKKLFFLANLSVYRREREEREERGAV